MGILGIGSLACQKSATPSSVEVTSSGSQFDPPVDKKQLPNGAWYCDMGLVHYARTEKGDGKCALCGMELKQNDTQIK